MGEKEKREKKRKEIKKDHKNIVMLNAIQICSNLTKKKALGLNWRNIFWFQLDICCMDMRSPS